MIAESFAIAIGWSIFNMMEVIFACEATALQTTYGAIAFACVITIAGFFVFRALVIAGDGPAPAPDEEWSHKFWHRLRHFG